MIQKGLQKCYDVKKKFATGSKSKMCALSCRGCPGKHCDGQEAERGRGKHRQEPSLPFIPEGTGEVW